MRYFVLAILGIFALLCILTFIPYPPAVEQARFYFTPEQIEHGQQYALQRRVLLWGQTFLEVGLLLALGLTAWGRWQARASFLRGSWLAAVLLIGATVFLLQATIAFPFSVARFYLSRSWGLTHRDFLPWLSDWLLHLGIEAIFGGIALVGLYLLLRFVPRWWYVLATLGGGILAALVAFLLPLVIAPLFNRFVPLEETKWAEQAPALYSMTESAGVPVTAILVMDASRQGSHTNAYFTGFGSSRRIVLFDTLLEQHTPAEVQSILAHELGHWIHHHIYEGIALGMIATLAGLIVLDRILRWARGRRPWQLTGLADPAGIPLILLLGYLASWVAMPVENAVSRHFERQADTTSLQIAGAPAVFIEAEKRLAVVNISNVAAAPWNELLFSTHPSAVQRIQMGERWQR